MSRIFSHLRQITRPWVTLTALACSAMALLVGGVVYASAPLTQTETVIHGCLNTNSHVLRVMNLANRCTASETPLNWAQRGLTGAHGARGKRGTQGSQGAVGVTGTTGSSGAVGATGATGAQGVQGFTGATGAQGVQGFTGATGAPGVAGIMWMGNWSPLATYAVHDAVAYGGSSWIAVAANYGTVPGSGYGYWTNLAQQGATGPKGATGVQGAGGVSGLEYNVGSVVTVPGSGSISTSLGCSAGKRVISGGFIASTSSVSASASYPNMTTNVWTFKITNNSANPATVILNNVCARTS